MFTRRQFLHAGTTAAGASFLALADRSPGLLIRAAEAARAADRNDRILVVIEMSGGNDGLNTLVPYENPAYYRARPTLALPKNELHSIADGYGLHPRAGALAELFGDGLLAIVQGVGYPEPDRSHFRSMEIWHTGSTKSPAPLAGWLGRCVDAMPADVRAAMPALAMSNMVPQALRAASVSVPAVEQFETLRESVGTTDLPAEMTRKLSVKPRAKAGPAALIAQQAQAMYRAAEQLRGAETKYRSTVAYPETEIAGRLQKVAKALSADLGVRIFYVSQDGYDTHATQADGHGQLLQDLSEALKAFLDDVEQLGLGDRVVTMAFSEFGRRVDENASRGTDHGAASCLLVAGRSVRGGLLGKYPSLEKLGDGDLLFNTDFRSVYATLLDRWLGCPSEPLLGAKFAHLDIVGG
ncbi:MAG TPA: DUF1501 domain-containing protein [Pirellulales bacterium]|jgi:uncharacterized protein (DUF1501 family)|nr:DUF1501 domain-containing protein [Pirellulales bacterium]